jgi:hypothetical protein
MFKKKPINNFSVTIFKMKKSFLTRTYENNNKIQKIRNGPPNKKTRKYEYNPIIDKVNYEEQTLPVDIDVMLYLSSTKKEKQKICLELLIYILFIVIVTVYT